MGAARKLNFSPTRKSRWLEWIELEAKELEQCELECNGLTWAFSHLLSKKNIAHEVMSGIVHRCTTGEAVVPHYWIEFQGGWILDLRLRLWLGDMDSVPHGVFHRDTALAMGVKYEGEAELRTGVEYTEPFLDCLTYGMIHLVEFSRPEDVL